MLNYYQSSMNKKLNKNSIYLKYNLCNQYILPFKSLRSVFYCMFFFFLRNVFPISRSLSTSRRRTDELGSRLERPIHFECKLNKPMHIGMRLLHPAAADHSVSINRQQVQRIFSFSLRSRAVLSFCSTYLFPLSASRLWCWQTAIQRWWSSLSSGLHTSGCTTPCCVAATISPVRFSTLKEQTLL